MGLRERILASGQRLAVEVVEPPFGELADYIADWCWGEIRRDLVEGQLARWLSTPYFVGRVDGRPVASMGLFTRAERAEVGLVEFVRTDEAHRRRGIASILLGELIEHFCRGGGQALYLCTTNPHAGALYEKHGFAYTVGDGMRYLAPEATAFERTYLAADGPAQVRAASWADLPEAAVLYNHPEPGWLIKEPLSQCGAQTRFESHFVKLMRRVEGGRGAFLVLATPRGRMAGAALVERLDTYAEQHVAQLSFRLCPAYRGQAGQLLAAVGQAARDLNVGILQTPVADGDDEPQALLRAAGFALEARLPQRLGEGGGHRDLLIYGRRLEGALEARRPPGDYYGGRQAWQTERIRSG